MLADQLGLSDWGRDDEHPEFEARPLQAIVKEFVSNTSFTPKDAPTMIQTIHALHRCGIIVHDVKHDAYVGTQLVDLSLAVTAPHVQFDARFDFNTGSEAVTPLEDLARLDDYVFTWWNERVHRSGPRIWVRAYSSKYELRSWKEPGIAFEPRSFDWRGCANEWTKLPRRSARIEKVAVQKPLPARKVGKRRKRKTIPASVADSSTSYFIEDGVKYWY